ncbi:hypothetical protein GCM10025865_12010 [Paraoerskovia sediminicola]|uniref:DUF2316 family protein n=1 Tax=Paraoerskovia sediminicola TaxID=1138587 RepID=A0ABN6XAD9_9CELL|nr:DUF2316 family protein [Paraoerskovia sediminicola]BDZ41902.1 hypothetical protein GCM10025865_12010 [Paraoerskovia sediminicola]
MSLNTLEMQQTSQELRANLGISGLTVPDLATELDMEPTTVESVLAMDGSADPADVWLVRDHMQNTILMRRRTPFPYTRLTDEMRTVAKSWFSLHEAPLPR